MQCYHIPASGYDRCIAKALDAKQSPNPQEQKIELDLGLLDLLWESRGDYLGRESWLAYGEGREKVEKSAWG